jgi:hypothetical protein
MILFITAHLFEKYHPTETKVQFNSICDYSVLALLAVNMGFLLFLVIVMVLYALRQIFRLMNETLLSTNATLQPSELNQLLNMKKTFEQI